MSQPRLCFVINHAAFFVSHRLPLAIQAINEGYRVSLITGKAGSESMEQAACEKLSVLPVLHYRVDFKSAGVNPIKEGLGLLQMFLRLKKIRPDIVHCASPKGVLYGGIAARIAGVPNIVLAVSGMGYAFTNTAGFNFGRRFIGLIYRFLAKFAFGHKNLHVIVQNCDDLHTLLSSGWVSKDSITLIPGSGVNLAEFPETPLTERDDTVLFPARVLYDKGVREFIEAARIVRRELPEWRFVIAGAADYENPSAAPKGLVERWVSEGVIEWLGHVDNMPEHYMRAKIVCLPSYREGMPKALLEAAAAGCAVVTTDVTGCREAIEDGVTGDLVPVRDADSLARTLIALMKDEERRKNYAAQGRRRAVERFSLDSVVNVTLNIYQDLRNNAQRNS